MKQYRLSEEDIKKVAHEVALRAGLERGANLYTTVVNNIPKHIMVSLANYINIMNL